MKQGVNSYSARISASVRPLGFDGAVGLRRRAPRFPNYVWLAMVILTISALSYSAYSRAREQMLLDMSSYRVSHALTRKVIDRALRDARSIADTNCAPS